MIYNRDKKLKNISCPESWYNNNWKKIWFEVTNLKGAFFTGRVSVINHYHINWLQLFWETLYIEKIPYGANIICNDKETHLMRQEAL